MARAKRSYLVFKSLNLRIVLLVKRGLFRFLISLGVRGWKSIVTLFHCADELTKVVELSTLDRSEVTFRPSKQDRIGEQAAGDDSEHKSDKFKCGPAHVPPS